MNVTHPHFAEPQWLCLALVGPLSLAILHRYSSWMRAKQLSQLAAPQFLKALTRSHSRTRRLIKSTLLVLALTMLGLALARPQWGERTETSHLLGQDILFVLDCSRSMLATDVTPSRLQRAKLAILNFVQRQNHGRVGLVGFAGQAFLQCPLTFDYAAFQDALMLIDDKTIPIPGTDVGRALEEANLAMDKTQREKVMVLVTDGEDLEKGGLRVAEKLGTKGVTVFSVGVGTAAGSEIQFLNEQGKLETLEDSKGQVVRSRLDEPTLRAIAQATRGAYYPLGPLGEGLAKIRLDLQNLSTTSGSAPERKLGVDRFHIPLAAGLLLLTIEPLISTRRRLRQSSAAELPARLPRPSVETK